MVLGIRSKSRKRVSIQVHYIIHVQEIKPWPPSQSLRSVQSVLLQWENGDHISGSLASSAGDGAIKFNESFRLSTLLWKEASKKGKKQREKFHKNCLEFHLYDKTVKSHLLGSATINLAEFGNLTETKATSTVFHFKRSFRHSAQSSFLYVNIQPFDLECSNSSPSSSISKDLSVDNEESGSVSQSVNDDDDIEIASFTDDDDHDHGDDDGTHTNNSQNTGSASETSGDIAKISKGGTKGSNGEFVPPLESTTTSSFLGNTEGEASTRFNEIKSSTALSSDTGNDASGSPSLPKISEVSVKVADVSFKTPESVQQSQGQSINEVDNMIEAVVSPALYIASSMQPNFDRSSRPQVIQGARMTQEDSTRDQIYKDGGPEKVSSASKSRVLEAKEKLEERGKQQEQFTRNELSENELVNDFSKDDSTRKEQLNSGALPLIDKSHEQPTNVLMNDKAEKMEERRKQQEQFTRNELSENEPVNDFSDDDSTRKEKSNSGALPLINKSHEHPTSVLMNDKAEKMEERGKQQEQFTGNELSENELVNDFSDDDSTRKEKSNSGALLLINESYEHPTSVLMNDKAENVRSLEIPLQSSESFGLCGKSQTIDQEEEIDTLNDIAGNARHGDINVSASFVDDKNELKGDVEMLQEELREVDDKNELKGDVEMLQEELREAAALEVSLYSVIAEHGSSSNKVNAPARRLSRFYFHACRFGSPAMKASAAQSAVSGFVLVSKACGNDVPRLTFWLSNLILLRAIVSKEVENIHHGNDPCIHSECDGNGPPLHEDETENAEKHFHSWEDPETFLVALEKVEAWIFSRIVESVWWQTLTPYMQSAAAKSSSSRRIHGRGQGISDQNQGNFSIDLWKRAFKDACERLCPLRAGGLACACLPVIARLVMEQLVIRLDVAMFNAVLRESDEEMPTDPTSDPISDSKVLPIPAGKSGLGAGAQLKNAIGDWSRWLSNLFGIDDSDSHDDSNENDELKCESQPFKPFPLLNALSDLMMLPFEMLADESTRKEVCPRFGVSLIKRVVNNFVPDEFSPGPVPNTVVEALNREDIQDDEGSISSIPCTAGSTFYAPPPASSMLQEVGTQTLLRNSSSLVKKLYTSDDELDELDSPLSALGMDDSSLTPKKMFTAVKGGRKVVRYELLRQVWKCCES